MSRRRAAVKREVLPDPKFGDAILTKFMNCLMYEGKKSVAERIVYGALDRIAKRSGQEPLRVFHDALGNVRPAVEERSVTREPEQREEPDGVLRRVDVDGVRPRMEVRVEGDVERVVALREGRRTAGAWQERVRASGVRDTGQRGEVRVPRSGPK